jgi:hypothetical protein
LRAARSTIETLEQQARDKDAQMLSLEVEVTSLVDRLRKSSQPTPPHPEDEELLSSKLKRALAGANARISGLQKTVDVLQQKVRTLQKTISEKGLLEPRLKTTHRARSQSVSTAGAKDAAQVRSLLSDHGRDSPEDSEDFHASVRNLSRAFDGVSEPEEKAAVRAQDRFPPNEPVNITTLLTGMGPGTIVQQPSHLVSLSGPVKPRPTPIPLHESWPNPLQVSRSVSAPRKRPPSSSHTTPK